MFIRGSTIRPVPPRKSQEDLTEEDIKCVLSSDEKPIRQKMMILQDIVWREGSDFCSSDMMVMVPTCMFSGKALAAVLSISLADMHANKIDARDCFSAADPTSLIGISPPCFSPLSSPISILRRNALRCWGRCPASSIMQHCLGILVHVPDWLLILGVLQ